MQNSGETVEGFIRSLHELAENCDFGNKSEQIRDRVVIGIRDKELSEKLQLLPDLTLDKACEIARNSELVKSQVKDLQSKNLDAVSTHPTRQNTQNRGSSSAWRRGATGGRHNRGQRKNQQAKGPLCDRCNQHHDEGQCPANGRRCRKCTRVNHFAVCCKTQTSGGAGVHEVLDNGDTSDGAYFLGSITNCENTDAWYTKLRICGRPINFKIDSGADISVISEATYRSLPFQPKLTNIVGILQTPGGSLACKGRFKAVTRLKGRAYSFQIAVIPGTDTRNSLLSRSVASTMGLIHVGQVDSVADNSGTMKGDPVKITLRPDATPYCLPTARRIPFALMPKVKAELDRLERDGVIMKVTEPTDWCAPIVPVTKKNGNVRLCVDLKRLNAAVKREYYMLPNLDDIAPKLCGATVFSKLDAECGFHQIPLSEDSQKLTTFITPFGRYCYTRLPFGITSAPEIFQRRMSEVLAGQEGADAIIDDVLIYGKTVAEHDQRLKETLERIKNAGIKLNPDKCEYRKEEIEYFGHKISKAGVQPSPERIRAIREMPPPTNVAELRRIIGMITYLGRFVPDLSTIMSPINSLLKSDTAWTWDQPQIDAYEKVKGLITDAPALAFYNPSRPTVVSADASSYGIGAALYQDVAGELKPIAFASRTLSDAEKKYAQIEKECLAGVWACEEFDRYLTGIESFMLITDHKPLVPLINTQDLNRCPLRCQRLLMHLRRFNVTARHVPGKQPVVPDTLSRSPLGECDSSTETDVNAYVASVTDTKPLTDKKLEEIRAGTSADAVLPEVMKLTKSGWPDREGAMYPELKPYFASRYELSVHDGLLFYRDRLVIPEALRADVLQSIHTGHLGLNKCRERAKVSVWWPGLSRDLENLVKTCEFCNINHATQRNEPLKPTALPSRPWQRVGADLCEQAGKQYLVVMDYYSRYIEIVHLESVTSDYVIGKVKTCSRVGASQKCSSVTMEASSRPSRSRNLRFSMDFVISTLVRTFLKLTGRQRAPSR